MIEPSIEFSNVTLKLPVFSGGSRTRSETNLGGRIERGLTGRRVVALEDVSFALAGGDRVAILGVNGAGKTTLLRAAAGIYYPSSGVRDVRGRVSCLLQAGIGLSPTATGIENIRLGCALYGLTGRAWQAAVQRAADFSDLGPYLDVPMAHYSNGMRTRIGISIIITIDPEILIIDEVFAAGDADFAEKARKAVIGVLERSKILMFASHSESLVREFCNLGLLLNKGRLEFFGDIEDAFVEYKTARKISR